MSDVTDEMIERCRSGDASAFAQVVETYERPLFAYVYRFTAGEKQIPDPEDIVQDIFLKVWKALPKFDSKRSSSFQAWLFSVARNHLISILRKKRPDMVRDDDEGDGLFGRIVDVGASSPREVAEANQLKDEVAAAVSSLTEKLRTAFILRYYEDMPYSEIAEVLQCSEGTVKSRISRAREILSLKLRDHLGPESGVQQS